MWCSSQTPTPNTIVNLDQTKYWLNVLKTQLPSLTLDFSSKLESIKALAHEGAMQPKPRNQLTFAANEIDALYTAVLKGLPPP